MFVTSLKSNLGTVLTAYDAAKYNHSISHAQNTTAFQPSELLTGILWVLVTNKGRWRFSSTNNSQGQLQTPQSVCNYEYFSTQKRELSSYIYIVKD